MCLIHKVQWFIMKSSQLTSFLTWPNTIIINVPVAIIFQLVFPLLLLSQLSLFAVQESDSFNISQIRLFLSQNPSLDFFLNPKTYKNLYSVTSLASPPSTFLTHSSSNLLASISDKVPTSECSCCFSIFLEHSSLREAFLFFFSLSPFLSSLPSQISPFTIFGILCLCLISHENRTFCLYCFIYCKYIIMFIIQTLTTAHNKQKALNNVPWMKE